MSPVKLKVIVVTTPRPLVKAFFVLLAEYLLLVEFLYGKSFEMLKISTNTSSLKFLQLEHQMS